MVPFTGTYKSEDGVYKITISSVNSYHGIFSGKYESAKSPEGALNIGDITGSFRYVMSKSEGRDGVAPFIIGFSTTYRADGRVYAIRDAWEGVYQVGDTLLLTGSRAYVNDDGTTSSTSLGTKTFSA